MWRSMATGWAAWLSWAAVTLLVACGGGTNPTQADLRFVNATSGYPALDLLIDDDRRFSSVVFGQTAKYIGLDPDKTDSVVALPGSTTPLLSLTPALEKKKHYTLLAYGIEGAPSTVLLDENASEDDDKARLRIVNATPDAGSVDVYVTAPSDPLSTAVPLQSAAAVGAVGAFSTVSAKTWRIRVTGAGDKTDLRFDVSNVALAKKQVATLVITPSAGGVLVSALLLTQEGSIVALSGAQARVRVAAPNSGTVSASVGGVALMDGVAGPAVGDYRLVPSGTQPVTVSVDGTPLTLADVTLDPGTDQTLLVYRRASMPGVTWLPDDNRPPTSAGNAHLRLVQGLDGLSGALSMNASFLPVAGGVTLGTASPYGAVSAGTNVRITVTAAGTTAPVVDLLDQTLLAGHVYSVFMIEGIPPDSGFLRRDR